MCRTFSPYKIQGECFSSWASSRVKYPPHIFASCRDVTYFVSKNIDCCHNLKNNSLPFQGFNLFNGQIRLFSPKGDVFATMMAVFWNKTVLGFRPVQELALRHKDGRTGCGAKGHSHHEWCFCCFCLYHVNFWKFNWFENWWLIRWEVMINSLRMNEEFDEK